VTGTVQWLALRRHLRRAGWWVLASTVGFAAFGAVAAGAFESVGGGGGRGRCPQHRRCLRSDHRSRPRLAAATACPER
jgi:hypothetical protein